jgi:hypothetical protein
MGTTEIDDRDCLCDSHRSYMERYIQAELARQEKVSERFLRERSNTREASIGRTRPKTRLPAS